MKTPDPPASIPAPAAAPDQPVLSPADRPWSRPIVAELDYHRWLKEAAVDEPALVDAATVEELPPIGDELTVYEFAMVCSGRHPYPKDFGPYDDRNKHKRCLTLLKLGLSERLPDRQHAQRSWNLYCEITEKIKRGKITPIKTVRDFAGEIDPINTVIPTAHLRRDATSKRVPLQILRVANNDKSRAAEWALRKLYGADGYPKGMSDNKLMCAVNTELRQQSTPVAFRGTEVSRQTIGRLLDPRRRRGA
jgi:hypothetical protein